MTKAQQIYAGLFKQANESVKTSSALQKALPWLVGGGAVAAGVPLAYRFGKKRGIEEEEENRPLTFGAGALTGLVAPRILKQLKSTVGMGLGPGGVDSRGYGNFTEF